MNKKVLIIGIAILLLIVTGCSSNNKITVTDPKPPDEVEANVNALAEEATKVGQENFAKVKAVNDYCALMPVADVERITGKKIASTSREFGCSYSGDESWSLIVSLTPSSGTVEEAKKSLKASEAQINKQSEEMGGFNPNISFTFTAVPEISEDAVFQEGMLKVLMWSHKNHPGHLQLVADEGTHVKIAQLINANLSK